jgi:hypothetical protein
MTTSGGFLQINIREDSRTFDLLDDWSTYDYLQPGTIVQFTIAGTDNRFNNVQYRVSHTSVLSFGNRNYPLFYYYRGQYWQWDGRNLDPISWKQAEGERVIYGAPPVWGYA